MTTPSRKKRSTPPDRPEAERANAGSGTVVPPKTARQRSPRAAASDSRLPQPARSRGHSDETAWRLVFGVWVIAALSTLGALFFSEVMQLPPCALCWYQRIFIFPLVLLLPMGLLPFDPRVVRYALPLVVVGTLFSLFQLLLIYGVIPESVQPCSQGVSCKEVQIQWLGFLSIPLLSFVAFVVMNALLIAAHLRSSK
jgi:disulfide bond formation protein DsbB